MKGIFLVSLNSRKLEQFLAADQSFVVDDRMEKLDLFGFDTFEVLNGIFFFPQSVREQNTHIEEVICEVIAKMVSPYGDERRFLRLSEMQKDLATYQLSVHQEYYKNPKFKRNCKSQIFQNLQPKLREVGITNHKSHLIEILAPFLLAEIALYLFVFDSNCYDLILGLEAEMSIIADIKNGKYPVFMPFVKQKTTYQKVDLQLC
jgi:hypothetical protein